MDVSPTAYVVTLSHDWDGNVRTWDFDADEFHVAEALRDSLLLLVEHESVTWEVLY